jgi:hypothetical protein
MLMPFRMSDWVMPRTLLDYLQTLLDQTRGTHHLNSTSDKPRDIWPPTYFIIYYCTIEIGLQHPVRQARRLMQSLGVVIGRGGSARVHLGFWRDSNVAVKMLVKGEPDLYGAKTRSQSSGTVSPKRCNSEPLPISRETRSLTREVRFNA